MSESDASRQTFKAWFEANVPERTQNLGELQRQQALARKAWECGRQSRQAEVDELEEQRAMNKALAGKDTK